MSATLVVYIWWYDLLVIGVKETYKVSRTRAVVAVVFGGLPCLLALGSLEVLLDHLGVADLFPARLRLDKETGVHKTDHLAALAKRLEIRLDEITFVDDKVNHLERVAALGVRPVLAGWGHNTPREHARAADLGFAVARLDTADAVLFGAD